MATITQLEGTSDRIKFTLEWVWGVCILWNQQAKQFDAGGSEMIDFVHRTHHIVWKYLNNRQTLDGTCSDLECDTALRAKRLFGIFPEAQ